MTQDATLTHLLERCRRDHLAWINGDGSGYELPDDGTILGAIGGHSSGGEETGRRQVALASQWRVGTGTIEFINGGVEGDLAWLTLIERGRVELTTDPAGTERRWDLRVTEVFRRSHDGWHRLHRHADPLVDRRVLAEVTLLLV